MKRRGVFFAALLLVNLIFGFVSILESVATDAIEWKGHDEGISLANAENKNIFLFFMMSGVLIVAKWIVQLSRIVMSLNI